MNYLTLTKNFVREILEHPLAEGRQWTFQGLGMLRLYLSKQYRIHVWAPSRAVANVSTLHTHPWHFESQVVCGHVQNKIFVPCEVGRDNSDSFWQGRIKCGAGGGMTKELPEKIQLRLARASVILAGDSYQERAEEIHESVPSEGAVTIVDRMPTKDADHALVFWPEDTQWVNAEPRPATDDEVREICGMALKKYFSSIR